VVINYKESREAAERLEKEIVGEGGSGRAYQAGRLRPYRRRHDVSTSSASSIAAWISS
jgi:hypothetical protein